LKKGKDLKGKGGSVPVKEVDITDREVVGGHITQGDKMEPSRYETKTKKNSSQKIGKKKDTMEEGGRPVNG